MSDEPVPEPDTSADSPAVYLARCLIADRGYVDGYVAEAAALAEAADVVLTGGDGVGLAIACIVDRDRDPERRFTMPAEQVEAIASACRGHVGRVHGVREAVTVEIWEVGAGLPRDGDRARLDAYTFRQRAHDGVNVTTYAVDSAGGAVISTAGDWQQREPWIRKVMTEPRRTRAALATAVAARRQTAARFQTTPFATTALLLVFAAMFVVELAWTVLPAPSVGSPSIATLVSLGALERTLVEGGDWWRMLTCAFLHGSIIHLLFNCIAMYMAGGVLENLVGRAWMLALFVLGAVGGSVMSMVVNEHAVSVGASGAIMGLLAAGMVLSLRLPRGPARTQILVSLGYMLVPSLLPLATGTDYGAHFGGAITGAVVGGILLATWPRTDAQPRARKAAAALAAAGLLATAFGLVQAATDRDSYLRLDRALDPTLTAMLVPNDQIAASDIIDRAPALLEQYPRDPRLHFYVGITALQEFRLDDARGSLERALAEDELIRLMRDPEDLRIRIRYVLAMTHEAAGNVPLAIAAVTPSCPAGRVHNQAAVRAYYLKTCVEP